MTAEAARESGLLEGTPVVVGTSDTAVENYSAGAIYPGQGIVKLATAGNVCIMMGMPVTVPKAGDSSFGAALVAGVGIGLFPDVRTAVERCVHFEESITPDRENHEKYGRYFAVYRKIHDALAPVEKLIHETFVMGT